MKGNHSENKTKWKIPAAVAAICLLAALVFLFVIGDPPPRHNGKSLEGWITDWNVNGAENNPQTEEALRAMGHKAIPPLVRMLTADETVGEQAFRWLRKFSPVKRKKQFDPGRPFKAAKALAIIARADIVDPNIAGTLAPHLTNSSLSYEIAVSLSWMGPTGIQELTNALNNPETANRLNYANALRQCRDGAPVEPLLLLLIKDNAMEVRSMAAVSLAYITQDSDVALPHLLETLHDTHATVRGFGAYALSWLGKHARAAIPQLEKLLQDPDPEVQARAKAALEKIQPQPDTR